MLVLHGKSPRSDDEDYGRHVEYCYINPVKHGLVTRVRDWPFSSFHRDVAAGLFPQDWARSRRSANSARRQWRNKAIAPYGMLHRTSRQLMWWTAPAPGDESP
jgi:hypothetical protein